MSANASHSRRRASTIFSAAILASIAVLSPAAALAAPTTSTTKKILGVEVPASARIHTTTAPTPTTTPASTTPSATTTPIAKATTTPANTQPGTVPPASTTPASAIPRTSSSPSSTSTTTTIPTTTAPGTSTQSAPAGGSTTVVVVHKSKSHATRLSTGALVLAIVGALLLLGCIVWALSRWLALEPRWTISLMHSMREASYRASATWAEFSDWARIGR